MSRLLKLIESSGLHQNDPPDFIRSFFCEIPDEADVLVVPCNSMFETDRPVSCKNCPLDTAHDLKNFLRGLDEQIEANRIS
jgi:hypothetical protein